MGRPTRPPHTLHRALRERARVREEKAEQREVVAREQAEEARRQRDAAEATARRADELDPDVD